MAQGDLIASMQSVVPDLFPRTPVTLDDNVWDQKLKPQPPQLITANADVAKDAYNVQIGPFPLAEKIFITNLGTTPIKYSYLGTASATQFNGVIPGGTAQDDGLGGKAEFSPKLYGITRISVITTGAGLRCIAEQFTV